MRLLIALCAIGFVVAQAAPTCASEPTPIVHDYSSVLAPSTGVKYEDLPGFTRSAYYPDHALVTAESRVWAPNPAWKNGLTAHIISPASGALFAMYLVDLKAGGESVPATPGVERFVLLLQGEVQLSGTKEATLPKNHYVFFPANDTSKLTSKDGAGLLVYERLYKIPGGKAVLNHGNVEDSPLLVTPGEVFQLRKLLPATADYDFNIHVMDFRPGEHLNVKEVHYNQHGLLMLEGKGIYRLADKWYPVHAGDAIWMAPYVVQWYAALGTTPTRYVILKDTTVDPLF